MPQALPAARWDNDDDDDDDDDDPGFARPHPAHQTLFAAQKTGWSLQRQLYSSGLRSQLLMCIADNTAGLPRPHARHKQASRG